MKRIYAVLTIQLEVTFNQKNLKRNIYQRQRTKLLSIYFRVWM